MLRRGHVGVCEWLPPELHGAQLQDCGTAWEHRLQADLSFSEI